MASQLVVFNLPQGITIGAAYNLIYTFPGLCGYELRVDQNGSPILVITMASLEAAQNFYKWVHGRRFDIFDHNGPQLVVVYNQQGTDGQQSEPCYERQSEPEYSAKKATLWGTGFSKDEDEEYLRNSLEDLRLPGMQEIRCVQKRQGNCMVFVDFESDASAGQALQTLRRGLKLRTGICVFRFSSGNR